MPITSRIERFPRVDGGMRDSYDHESVNRNQVSYANNVYLDVHGYYMRRGGTTLINSTALDGAVKNIWDFKIATSSGISRKCLVVAGRKWYDLNLTTGVATQITDAAINWNVLTGTNRPSVVTYTDGSGNPVAVLANGTDFIMWDGTHTTGGITNLMTATVTSYGDLAVSAPKYLLVAARDLLFAGGIASHPSRIHYCAALNPTNWTNTHFLNPQPDDGDIVKGLGVLYDFPIFFKENTVHLLTGTSSANFAMTRICSTAGTTSHWSIIPFENFIYFVDQRHIYVGFLRDVVEDGMDVRAIHGSVDRHYSSILTDNWNDITGVYNPNIHNIYWGIRRDTQKSYTDTVLLYSTYLSNPTGPDYLKDSRFVWSGTYTGLEAHCFGMVEDTDGNPKLYMGDGNGYVYRIEQDTVYKDNSNDFISQINLRTFSPGGKCIFLKFTPYLFQKYPENVTCEWVTDLYNGITSAQVFKLKGNIPYWNDGVSSGITTRWSSTIWHPRPFLRPEMRIGTRGENIMFILKNNGTRTKDDWGIGNYEIEFKKVGM